MIINYRDEYFDENIEETNNVGKNLNHGQPLLSFGMRENRCEKSWALWEVYVCVCVCVLAVLGKKSKKVGVCVKELCGLDLKRVSIIMCV